MNIKNKKSKRIISIVLFIVGILLAIYIGGWLLFIKPIIACCIAFDAGTLTAFIVGVSVIKVLCASAVAGVIFWITSTISILIGD